LSTLAVSDCSGSSMTGSTVSSSSSVNPAASRSDSRARIQLTFPRMVLNSPLWMMFR